MKCAGHVDFDAVGTCNICGKGLCQDCVAVFTPPLCGGCALAHNKGIATSLWLHLAMMGGLFAVAFSALIREVPALSAVGYSLMVAFFPSGWSFLGRYFSPSGGYLFPMARWVNLFGHAFVAALLGMIVGPIFLLKAWKELRIVRGTRKLVAK
jgi:hypothetical protein